MMIDVNGYYIQLVGIHEQPDVIRIMQSLSIYRRVRRSFYYSIYITPITITIMHYAYCIYFITSITITITIRQYFRKKARTTKGHKSHFKG